MTRFHVFAVVALCGMFPMARAADAPRPNVLFVCVDDLKPILGCYDAPIIRSPHVDRLASRGVRFINAFTNQAVCAPSRNSLLTGKRSTSIGIYDLGTHFRLAVPDAVTVPQLFKQNGWRSEAMGKILHVGHGNHEDPESWSVPHWAAKRAGYALDANKGKDGRGAPVECADVPDSTYNDGRIADEAITRLRAAKGRPDQPFFIAVGFLKPHLPFVAPKKYWDLYQRGQFKLPDRATPPDGAPEFAPTDSGELRQYTDIPATGPLTSEKALELIHGYHAAVSYMDAQFGRVLDELDRLDLAKNTIIVFWGDHGWHLGDHGLWCKHTNYEQAARIPLIIAAPGVAKAGARTMAMAESVDIYPTLCELAGIRTPAGLDGMSLVPALRDPEGGKTKEAVFHAYPRSPKGMGEIIGRAVRTGRYRLVEWKKPGAPPENAVLELYDYESDPGETTNLAPGQPEVVTKLRAMLANQPEAKPQIRTPKLATEAKPKPAAADRNQLFANKDTDRDGKLTRDEFLARQPDPDKAPERFTRFDTDGDGVLTREEFVGMGKK